MKYLIFLLFFTVSFNSHADYVRVRKNTTSRVYPCFPSKMRELFFLPQIALREGI